MSVFKGVVSTVKVAKNSQINNLSGGLLNNLATSTASVAINQTFGAGVTTALGLNPAAGSNFLGSIITPGLVNTGVGGLNQALTKSIVNSKALGPFGPLVGNLAQSGLSYVSNTALQGLFGSSANSNNSLYFPGAGGKGEGPANYGEGVNSIINFLSGNRKSVYAIGRGGRSTADVLFSITPSLSTAAKEAGAATGGSSGAQPGATPAAPVPVTAAPAGVSNSGTPPPVPAAAAGGLAAGAAAAAGSAATAAGGAGSAAAAVAGAAASGALAVVTGSGAGGAASAAAAAATGAGAAPAAAPQEGWKFICAPEDISWETTVGADRVPIFGANYAPVQAGIRGMRELTLNGAIVEGFSRSVTVENKIKLLEDLTKMTISSDNRYLQIPVYKVTAQNKIYGAGTSTSEGGYFIIKAIKVQEKIRDFDGNTTRAVVDVSLIQVPSYQVERGRDIASPTVAGAKGPFEPQRQSLLEQARQSLARTLTPAPGSAAAASATPGATPAAGAAAGATPATTPQPPTQP